MDGYGAGVLVLWVPLVPGLLLLLLLAMERLEDYWSRRGPRRVSTRAA